MSHITYDDKRIELENGQTVLSALLDHGYEIPNSCRAGACQSCMMQAVEGEVPSQAQTGLKDTLIAQGYFLACSCHPETPLEIASANPESLQVRTTVFEHEIISNGVLRLRLKPQQSFKYRAGQFVNIWKDNKTSRSYSLASVSDLDGFLEFHIRLIDDGIVSSWLHNDTNVGDNINIQDASGDCFYIPGTPEQKLLLAGTGTGLAPLIGIARDALENGHNGEIHLIHGARQVEDLYMHQQLIAMSQQYSNFDYSASVLQTEDVTHPVSKESIDNLMLNIASNASEWKAYLCGDVTIVNTLKKKLFLAGASMSNIYSDPFISADNS